MQFVSSSPVRAMFSAGFGRRENVRKVRRVVFQAFRLHDLNYLRCKVLLVLSFTTRQLSEPWAPEDEIHDANYGL